MRGGRCREQLQPRSPGVGPDRVDRVRAGGERLVVADPGDGGATRLVAETRAERGVADAPAGGERRLAGHQCQRIGRAAPACGRGVNQGTPVNCGLSVVAWPMPDYAGLAEPEAGGWQNAQLDSLRSKVPEGLVVVGDDLVAAKQTVFRGGVPVRDEVDVVAE